MKRTHSKALTAILAAAIYSMWSLSAFAAAAPTKIVIGFAAMNARVAPLCGAGHQFEAVTEANTD